MPTIKLKTLVESLQTEMHLGGYSRSGGKPSWDHYIVPNFDSTKIYYAEKDSPILDADQNVIGQITKGEELNIVDVKLTTWGKRKYASVKIKKLNDELEGYLSITAIRKPTNKGAGAAGGVTSKEFLPTKLGLVGKSYSDGQALIADVLAGLEKSYGGDVYASIREYLTECMYLITGDISLTESRDEKKSYKLSKTYSISEQDIRILSKNFGEVLGALYVVVHNTKTDVVSFPSALNTPLYDFTSKKITGMTEYYSVKSHEGSSTSIENINFLLDNFDEKNELFDKYKVEIDVIKSIINDKTAGKTTLTNIQSFFETRLEDKVKEILKRLSSISQTEVKTLSQKDLDLWFKDVTTNSTEQAFVDTMNGIYTEVLGDLGKPPRTLENLLRKFFKEKHSKGNGYLYYPMGAYVKDYLNDPNKPYLKVLNILLNYGTYIHQFDVSLTVDSIDIKIGSFDQKKFKFSYNGMSNDPSNRPLGFKEAGGHGGDE